MKLGGCGGHWSLSRSRVPEREGLWTEVLLPQGIDTSSPWHLAAPGEAGRGLGPGPGQFALPSPPSALPQPGLSTESPLSRPASIQFLPALLLHSPCPAISPTSHSLPGPCPSPVSWIFSQAPPSLSPTLREPWLVTLETHRVSLSHMPGAFSAPPCCWE